MMLVDIGGGTWVTPEAIEAVDWGSATDCPVILLRGGDSVRARQWRSSPTRTPAETVEALMGHIAQAVRRLQAARWGYPVSDPATGTDSEGTTT